MTEGDAVGDQQVPSVRGTARDSGRSATKLDFPAGVGRANNAGTKPAAAIMPPSLAKNDLREQGELTCVWRFKVPCRRRSPLSNVKQNFHPTPVQSAY
jgi:hypothetical protein